MTLREAIGAAARRLSCISDTPRLDAELLAAHALQTSREALLLRQMDSQTPPDLDALIARRALGEPIAYILGRKDFWTISLDVRPGVLIPRPDSETLIEAAVAHFGRKGPASILDLGTGSGALLLAALDQWPEARGVGVDRSELAVATARGNASRLGMEDRAQILSGDWDVGIAGQFELILCNPPYVAADEALPVSVSNFEPAGALFAGADGLSEYRRLAPRIGSLMTPGGLVLFEIGASQGAEVSRIFAAAGHRPRVLKDLGGRDRCIALSI